MQQLIYFIVNPAAANGRARAYWERHLPSLQQAFPAMQWAYSQSAEHLGQLAVAALADGYNNLVAVGGDGTQQQVLNGIFNHYPPTKLGDWTYALLPLGSGNDWIRTHRIPKQVDAWIDMYKSCNIYKQNIGRIHYFLNGQPKTAYFANVAGLAYDAYVVQRAANSRIKNRWLYPLLTLWYLKDFKAPWLDLYFEESFVQQRFYTINIGIGRYSGGGMRLVPQAEPAGKAFALTYTRALHPITILFNSFRFYTGTIGQVRGVVTTFARYLQISSSKTADVEQISIEADGEWLGYGPVKIELLEAALPFRGPSNSYLKAGSALKCPR